MTAKALIIVSFFCVAVVVAVLEMLARRENSKIPTLSDLTAFVMTYRAGNVPMGRIAVLGFWWWLGWHFFAR